MADEPVVHIGENSSEQVAYKLFHDICNVEKRELYGHGDNPANREYILRAYRQCIDTVHRAKGIDKILDDSPR